MVRCEVGDHGRKMGSDDLADVAGVSGENFRARPGKQSEPQQNSKLEQSELSEANSREGNLGANVSSAHCKEIGLETKQQKHHSLIFRSLCWQC